MIIKEKNLLVFQKDNVFVGSIDINSGAIMGKRGKTVQRCNSDMASVFNQDWDSVPLISYCHDYHMTINEFLKEYGSYLGIIDSMLNAGVPLQNMPYNYTLSRTPVGRLKEILKTREYWGNLGNRRISDDSFKEWKANQELQEFLPNYSLTSWQKNMLVHIYLNCENNKKYILYILNHLLFNESIHMELNWQNLTDHYSYKHAWREISEYDLSIKWQEILINYYFMTRKLHRKWEKGNWVADLRYVYMEYHNYVLSEREEQFKQHVDPEVLSFETEDFVVITPKVPEDLKEEGRLMCHCVGSYVGDVIMGSCAIVFIRHKSDPNTPYITCEIRPEGRIGQYYKANDQHVTGYTDLNFKNKYQQFLFERADAIREMLGR